MRFLLSVFLFTSFCILFFSAQAQQYELQLTIQKPVGDHYVKIDTVIRSESPVDLQAQLNQLGIELSEEQVQAAQRNLFPGQESLQPKSVTTPNQRPAPGYITLQEGEPETKSIQNPKDLDPETEARLKQAGVNLDKIMQTQHLNRTPGVQPTTNSSGAEAVDKIQSQQGNPSTWSEKEVEAILKAVKTEVNVEKVKNQ